MHSSSNAERDEREMAAAGGGSTPSVGLGHNEKVELERAAKTPRLDVTAEVRKGVNSVNRPLLSEKTKKT